MLIEITHFILSIFFIMDIKMVLCPCYNNMHHYNVKEVI